MFRNRMDLFFPIARRCTWLASKIVITKRTKSNVRDDLRMLIECRVCLFPGWSNVYGYNMGCLKNYVMREPLVDTVDKRQICTDHFPLKVSAADARRARVDLHVLDIRFENNDRQRHRHGHHLSASRSTRRLRSRLRHLLRC